MSKCRLPIYSGYAEKIANKIRCTNDYYINTIYKNEENGFYWYENSRGYIHVLKVKPMTAEGGRVVYYAIEDSMLKADGMLKHETHGFLRTVEDAEQIIKEWCD